MVSENLEGISCKSKEYYRNITAIDVTPVRPTNYDRYLLHRKGEQIVKKRLFKKPIITTVQEDIYKIDGKECNATYMASYWNATYNPDNNTFHKRGKVVIHFKKEYETEYFNTNDEIMDFVSDLKEKCKKCGNELL